MNAIKNNSKPFLHCESVSEAFINTCEAFPNHGIYFISHRNAEDFLSYKNLYLQSKERMLGLYALGLKKNDRLIILADTNKETVLLLWACFLGGIIPTILQAPITFLESNDAITKLKYVIKNFQPQKIIVSEHTFSKWNEKLISKDLVTCVTALFEKTGNDKLAKMNLSDVAYVQYSSGSTNEPKGVILTHENILYNTNAIRIKLEFTTDDNVVSWMPLYHDMGLFGYLFTSLFSMANIFLIEPIDFIKNPFLWLNTLSEKRGTITGSPNFGFNLINKYFIRRKHENWDFSTLKVVHNGAEPISVKIMEEFMHNLQAYGFPLQAMMPVYGLAEATLAATFSGLHDEPIVSSFDRNKLITEEKAVLSTKAENSVSMTAVGKPLNDVELKIVNQNSEEVADNQIGEILLRGKCITKGYYNNLQINEELFQNSWLRTGDMGFWFENNLYISGRIKDIIFIHGKNYYANDLELLAQEIQGVEAGKVVFSGYFDEKNGFDMVCCFVVGSHNERTKEICKQIKNKLKASIGINVHRFVPLKSNQIPKTSSGKVQRYLLLKKILHGAFDEIKI